MYKLTSFNDVIHLASAKRIPSDPANADYKIYLLWVADGNVPQAADAPPPPSQEQIDANAAKGYAKLAALAAMTPAQIVTWVGANVTNLAQAQDAITTLAIGMSVLARRI